MTNFRIFCIYNGILSSNPVFPIFQPGLQHYRFLRKNLKMHLHCSGEELET